MTSLPLARVFWCLIIRASFRCALIRGNLTAQSDGEQQENWRWNSNSSDRVASSPRYHERWKCQLLNHSLREANYRFEISQDLSFKTREFNLL